MVYGTRFEIGRGVILTVGSNPTLSATKKLPSREFFGFRSGMVRSIERSETFERAGRS